MHLKNVGIFIRSLALIQVFLITLIVGVTLDTNSAPDLWLQIKSKPLIGLSLWSINIDEPRATELVSATSIVISGKHEENNWATAANYMRQAPQNILASNLPVLAYNNDLNLEATIAAGIEEELISPVDEAVVNEVSFDSNQDFSVFMYSTHAAETYAPDGGPARLDGQRGLIVEVGRHLQKRLQDKGVAANFYDKMHDSPDYDKSYTNSRQTIMGIVEQHPELSAVFDIHRDSIPGLKQPDVVVINGIKCAKILIIVGTDERKAHPNWRQNMEFAQKLAAAGEKLYPGLIKGVRTKAGTYNQEYHPRSLLLEMGNDLNRVEEAEYAAQLFADILLEVLQEEG